MAPAFVRSKASDPNSITTMLAYNVDLWPMAGHLCMQDLCRGNGQYHIHVYNLATRGPN